MISISSIIYNSYTFPTQFRVCRLYNSSIYILMGLVKGKALSDRMTSIDISTERQSYFKFNYNFIISEVFEIIYIIYFSISRFISYIFFFSCYQLTKEIIDYFNKLIYFFISFHLCLTYIFLAIIFFLTDCIWLYFRIKKNNYFLFEFNQNDFYQYYLLNNLKIL